MTTEPVARIELEEDCARCAGLCCVGLALDKGPDFAIDKPAGTPCPNLDGRALCKVHYRLTAEGFPGCVRYTCRGAGQRVVQEFFGGRSWQEEPALLGPMLDSFAALRALHERVALLETAGRLPLPEARETRRKALLEQLTPEGLVREQALRLAEGTLPGEVDAFLRALAEELGPDSARAALG